MSDQSPSLYGMRPAAPPPPGARAWRQPPFEATAKADANGAATIHMGAVPAGQAWVLERIEISANSTKVDAQGNPVQPTLSMYDGTDTTSATFLDGSTSGNGDIDDQGALVLFPDDQLTLVWAGCSVGAVCKCRVQYRVEAYGA